jgi:tight adherence protein B
MNIAVLFISFLILFTIILLAVSIGLRYLEERRKSQVSGMLQTASGEKPAEAAPLLEPAIEEQISMEEYLRRSNTFSRMRPIMQQAGMNWSLSHLVMLILVFAAVGAMFGLRFPILISRILSAVAMGCGFGLLPVAFVLRKRAVRMGEMEAQFPEALDFLSRSMRAGHAFSISLEMAGEEMPDPLGSELRTLFNEHNLGAPIEVALQNLVNRAPLVDIRFFASSVLLQRQTGGNLSEILTRLAYVIRERFRLRGQVKAASAHGRITALVLTLLPIATMLALLVVAPGYLQTMAQDPTGKYLIIGAVIGQLLGYFTMRRIINIKV